MEFEEMDGVTGFLTAVTSHTGNFQRCIRTWIKFVISIGSILRGKRRMLNSDKLTKALVASRWLFSSTRT